MKRNGTAPVRDKGDKASASELVERKHSPGPHVCCSSHWVTAVKMCLESCAADKVSVEKIGFRGEEHHGQRTPASAAEHHGLALHETRRERNRVATQHFQRKTSQACPTAFGSESAKCERAQPPYPWHRSVRPGCTRNCHHPWFHPHLCTEAPHLPSALGALNCTPSEPPRRHVLIQDGVDACSSQLVIGSCATPLIIAS
jgi:hypothetical protein